MDSAEFERIFAPKSIAVVGASSTPTRFGGRILRNVLSNGYEGAIYPVNPRYDMIGDLKCYPTVGDIEGEVDLAILTVSNDRNLPTLRDCVAKDVGLAVLFGAGYSETGESGEAAQEELRSVAAEGRLRILGPNCVGFLNVWDRVPATPAGAVDPPKLRPGGISVVAQSGFVGMESVFGRGHRAGLGFHYVFTTGNEVDLEAAELIEWLVEDEATTVIAAYLEGIRDPDRFRAAAAVALAADKPIVLLKSGRTLEGEHSARSHTAALAVSDAVVDAVCEAEGIIRVTDLDDLWEVAGTLDAGCRIGGPRVGVIGTSGGINTILSDDLREEGLLMPQLHESTAAKLSDVLPWYGSASNPVDLTGYFSGAGEQRVYPELAKLLADDPGIDVVVFTVQTDRATKWTEVIPNLIEGLREAAKPVIVLSGGAEAAEEALSVFRDTGIPVYWSPSHCARAIRLISDYQTRRAQLLERQSLPSARRESGGARPARLGGTGPRWAQEAALLADYGIETVATEPVSSGDEAVEVARRLGYPVVLKGLEAGASHKSDRGLVWVGLSDADGVLDAFTEIEKALGSRDGTIVVQPMVQGGVELIMGIQIDPTFGPVVLVGAGGVLVELLDDRRLAIPPLSVERAAELVESLRVAPMLHGFRGAAKSDVQAAAELLAGLSTLAIDLDLAIRGVDLNPVIVRPEHDGAVAVDWVLHLGDPS